MFKLCILIKKYKIVNSFIPIKKKNIKLNSEILF